MRASGRCLTVHAGVPEGEERPEFQTELFAATFASDVADMTCVLWPVPGLIMDDRIPNQSARGSRIADDGTVRPTPPSSSGLCGCLGLAHFLGLSMSPRSSIPLHETAGK